MTALAQALADAIDGTVRDHTLIIVPSPIGVHVVDCRPTGRIYLDGRFQLGSISDGIDHLAAMYRAATSEVTC